MTLTREGTPLLVRLVEGLSNILASLGGLALVGMMVTVIVDVTLRNVANQQIPGALDLVTFWWMPATALLPLALAELNREHIRLELWEKRISHRWMVRIEMVMAIVSLGVFAALFYYMFGAAVESMELREASASTPELPIWPFRFVAVVAMVGMFLQTMVTLYKFMIAGDDPIDNSAAPAAESPSVSGSI